jgi:uncharacterized BrkB/YihY/UPF0761 family membrane protein
MNWSVGRDDTCFGGGAEAGPIVGAAGTASIIQQPQDRNHETASNQPRTNPRLIIECLLLVVIVMLGLAVLYRYAPDREEPQWRWVSPGAMVATLWIIASIAFTVYVANSTAMTRPTDPWGALLYS